MASFKTKLVPLKAQAIRVLHWLGHEVKQPQIRPLEQKLIIWGIRALFAYFGIKYGTEIANLVNILVTSK